MLRFTELIVFYLVLSGISMNKLNQKSSNFYLYLAIALAAVPFLAVMTSAKNIYISERQMNMLFYIITFVGFAIFGIKNKFQFQTKNLSLLSIPMIGLVSLGAISIFWSTNWYHGIVGLAHWVCALFLAVLLWQKELQQEQRHYFLLAFVVSGGVAAFIGYLGFYFDIFIAVHAHKTASVFVNKNMLSHYMLALLPVSLGLLFSLNKNKKISLWIVSVCITLMLSMIFHLSARSSWVGFIAAFLLGLICIAIFSNFKRLIDIVKKRRLHLAFVFLSSFLLINFTDQGFTWFGQKATERIQSLDQSSARVEIFANTLALTKDHWVTGVGVGNWNVEYNNYLHSLRADTHITMRTRATKTHNEFLQIMAEYGIAGLLLTLFGLGFLVWFGWRLLKNHFNSMNLALLLSVFAMLTQANFTFPFHMAMPTMLLVIYLVLLTRQTNKAPEKTIDFNIPKSVWLGLTLVLGISGSMFYINDISGENEYRRAKSLYTAKRYVDCLKYTESSLSMNSFNSNAHAINYFCAKKVSKKRMEDAYKRSLALEPYHPYNQTLLNIGLNYYITTKDFDKAIEYGIRITDVLQHDWQKLSKVGELYAAQGNNEKAKEYYQRAVVVKPDLKNQSKIKKILEQ